MLASDSINAAWAACIAFKWLTIMSLYAWTLTLVDYQWALRESSRFYQKLDDLGYIHNSYAKHFWHWQPMQQLFQWDIYYFWQVKDYLSDFLKRHYAFLLFHRTIGIHLPLVDVTNIFNWSGIYLKSSLFNFPPLSESI